MGDPIAIDPVELERRRSNRLESALCGLMHEVLSRMEGRPTTTEDLKKAIIAASDALDSQRRRTEDPREEAIRSALCCSYWTTDSHGSHVIALLPGVRDKLAAAVGMPPVEHEVRRG